MERLFNENGCPGLHITDTAIEVVLRSLCNTAIELDNLLEQYGVDKNHPVIRCIYADYHGIDMAAHGFETVPVIQRTPRVAATTTEPEITCSNRFNALEDITLEEMCDFLEVYAFSSQELKDYVMDTDILQVCYIIIYI